MKKLLIISTMMVIGCTPAKHVYKVTFNNGDVEYYELNYKPKKGATAIDYNGETILGVEAIERID